jgi:hypothetical protein
MHDYEASKATIVGEFVGFRLEVRLDAETGRITCVPSRRIPRDVDQVLGFIPPLGQVAEDETLISNEGHLRKSLSTSLAPRHLRNHLYRTLSEEDLALVKTIVRDTWEGIELLSVERDVSSNKLACFYREGRMVRELAWAGQGLQIWFQLVTHLVRLRNVSILVLDEPEVFLHAEKQHDLVRLLREYHVGSSIVATHSVELMNDVDISHILHVDKARESPQVRVAGDRQYLESIRSQVGSSFNFVASQFEEVDLLVFTENKDDFDILRLLAVAAGVRVRPFGVSLGGFCEYYKSVYYLDAYKVLLGRSIPATVVLDRDYYPKCYVDSVLGQLRTAGINAVLMPGKEMENLFLRDEVFRAFVPATDMSAFLQFMNATMDDLREDCFASCLTLDEKYGNRKLDIKTRYTQLRSWFDGAWSDPEERLRLVPGKKVLQAVRQFAKGRLGKTLTLKVLVGFLIQSGNTGEVARFVADVMQTDPGGPSR